MESFPCENMIEIIYDMLSTSGRSAYLLNRQ